MKFKSKMISPETRWHVIDLINGTLKKTKSQPEVFDLLPLFIDIVG